MRVLHFLRIPSDFDIRRLVTYFIVYNRLHWEEAALRYGQ